MREGMYGVVFQAEQGRSNGSLVLQGGRIFGVDEGGALYDGEYADRADGGTELKITVSMPANVVSVMGASSSDVWSIDYTASGEFNPDQGLVRMDTPIGKPVEAAYRFLRPIAPPA